MKKFELDIETIKIKNTLELLKGAKNAITYEFYKKLNILPTYEINLWKQRFDQIFTSDQCEYILPNFHLRVYNFVTDKINYHSGKIDLILNDNILIRDKNIELTSEIFMKFIEVENKFRHFERVLNEKNIMVQTFKHDFDTYFPKFVQAEMV